MMTSTQTPVPQNRWGGAPVDGPTQVIASSRWAPAPQPQLTQFSAPPAGPWGPAAPPQPPLFTMPPAMPPAGPWGPQPQPPRNGGKKWAILATAVAVLATGAAVTVGITAGGSDDPAVATTMTTAGVAQPSETTAETKPEPKIATPKPATVLLTVPEIQTAIGGSIVVKGEGSTLANNSADIDRTECLNAWGPVEREAYRGSGYNRLAGQALEGADDKSRVMVQAAVSFPTVEDAEEYVAKSERSWQSCAGSSVISKTSEGKEMSWQFGEVASHSDGLITLSQTPVGSSGWGCERALGAHGGIVADTMVCGRDADGDGLAVAEEILAKVASRSA